MWTEKKEDKRTIEQIEELLNLEISKLHRRIWILENPSKFKVLDTVIIKDTLNETQEEFYNEFLGKNLTITSAIANTGYDEYWHYIAYDKTTNGFISVIETKLEKAK